MKLRHTAALALMGWYLMVPPFIGSTGIADQEPISAWQRFGPYKSESDCTKSKSKWQDFLKAPYADNDTSQEQALMAFQKALCVSENDPRLEKPPEEKNRPTD